MSLSFQVNEGTADRAIRIAIGLAGVSLVFFGPKTLFGLFGLLPLVTGIAGYCPLYTAIGVDTRHEPSAHA